MNLYQIAEDDGRTRAGRSEGAFVTSFTRSEELAAATAQLSEIAHVGRERRETLQCKSSCHDDLDSSPCRSWRYSCWWRRWNRCRSKKPERHGSRLSYYRPPPFPSCPSRFLLGTFWQRQMLLRCCFFVPDYCGKFCEETSSLLLPLSSSPIAYPRAKDVQSRSEKKKKRNRADAVIKS